MIWLILGVALWSGVRLIPTLAQPLKSSLIRRLGDGRYQMLFALVVVVSIGLMIFGWRASEEKILYQLPDWSHPVGIVLMWAALFLFAASQSPSVIKRVIRHPQLTSIALWGASHLLTNGSTRSLVLFGGLTLWALVEIPLINARDGVIEAPPAPGLVGELKIVLIATIIFVVLFFAHPYIAGVSLMSSAQ